MTHGNGSSWAGPERPWAVGEETRTHPRRLDSPGSVQRVVLREIEKSLTVAIFLPHLPLLLPLLPHLLSLLLLLLSFLPLCPSLAVLLSPPLYLCPVLIDVFRPYGCHAFVLPQTGHLKRSELHSIAWKPNV